MSLSNDFQVYRFLRGLKKTLLEPKNTQSRGKYHYDWSPVLIVLDSV